MNQKLFLVINGIVVLFLLGLYFRKKKESPSQLNLGGKTGLSPSQMRKVQHLAREASEAPKSGGTRIINVVFNHNGHSWDAFEVLGVPAGSSLDDVEKAYLGLVSRASPDDLPFFKAALEAIRKAHL